MLITPDNVNAVAQGLHWYCVDFELDDVREMLEYKPAVGELHNSTIPACNIYDELINGLDPHDLLERIHRCRYLEITLPSAESGSYAKRVRRVVANSESQNDSAASTL